MDHTFTTDDDDHLQIAGTGKGDLRKRQFTMHIYVNAGSGDDRDGYVELICKGKVLHGERFKEIERNAWHAAVKMYFQASAWMDRPVMEASAIRFCDHIKKRWPQPTKVLLFCDNLDAHVCDATKKLFGDSKSVFLFKLPPAVTEAIQAIDAGYGRSMRCAVGRRLDEWLMQEENMNHWEQGMTASERRILISNLVGQANDEVLADDDKRIGCFVRTGMLLTLDGSDDDKIKPQGCTKLPICIPRVIDLTSEEFEDVAPDAKTEVMYPEEQDGLITRDDEEINVGDETIQDNDVVVEEEDDNDDDLGATADQGEDEDNNNNAVLDEEEEAGSISSEEFSCEELDEIETVRSRRKRQPKRMFGIEQYAFY